MDSCAPYRIESNFNKFYIHGHQPFNAPIAADRETVMYFYDDSVVMYVLVLLDFDSFFRSRRPLFVNSKPQRQCSLEAA